MSAAGYQVRPYQDGDEAAIVELFNAVFGEDTERFEARTLARWNWEYRANPAGRQVMVAVQDSGRVIAHYACLPAAVQVQGEEAIAGQGVDSMVHPEFRRGLKKEGPFLAVARAYFETWGHAGVCHFGFGFPNRKAFRLGVRVLGYVPVHQPIPTLYRNFFEAPDDDAVGQAFAGDAEVIQVPAFDAAVNELWERLRGEYPMALIRRREYLNWRYGLAELDYRRFEVRRRGELVGWFVTRPNWQGLPILALADLLCHPGDEAVVALALRQAVKDARACEQARIEVWLPPASPHFQYALRHGFQTEKSQYVLCIMLYRDEPPVEWVRDNWYYTIGDSDVF